MGPRRLPRLLDLLSMGNRDRDGIRVIAERGLQIAGSDEFGDQLLRGCFVGSSTTLVMVS